MRGGPVGTTAVCAGVDVALDEVVIALTPGGELRAFDHAAALSESVECVRQRAPR